MPERSVKNPRQPPAAIDEAGKIYVTRVLVSNLGEGTLQLVEVSLDGRLKSLGKVKVGASPKRVAFLSLIQTP